jgi:hypothetical protein
VSHSPRLVALALAPGLVALLLAAIAIVGVAHTPSGELCSGRVYRAASQPESLVFSGERPAGEAERLRAQCHAGAQATVRSASRVAATGVGLLVLAGVGLTVLVRRTRDAVPLRTPGRT